MASRHKGRERDPVWLRFVCAGANSHVRIGKEIYFLSAAGS